MPQRAGHGHRHTGERINEPMRIPIVLLSWMLAAGAIAQEVQPQEAHPPGIDLPEGEGKLLLLAACTRCHDLKGLPAYKGYWDATRWRGMIETMVKNGAPLQPQQVGVLAEYLAQHFGKGPAESAQAEPNP